MREEPHLPFFFTRECDGNVLTENYRNERQAVAAMRAGRPSETAER